MAEPHQNPPVTCAMKRRAQLDRLKRTTQMTGSSCETAYAVQLKWLRLGAFQNQCHSVTALREALATGVSAA